MTPERSEALPSSSAVIGSTLRALVRAADLEVIPLPSLEAKLALVRPGTTITITSSVKLGLESTLRSTEAVVRSGHRAVPHLPARQVRDHDELVGFVDRLALLGITDLFVIGGDAAEPAGPFASALDLLEELAQIPHPFECIGVACYPEGHPAIPDDVLLDALLRKQVHATYMCSQLCFNADVITAWVHAARATGVGLPLHLSVAGPLHTLKLVELSIKIGVGASLKYLTNQRGLVGNLIRGGSYRPEELLHDLAPCLASSELGIVKLHVSTFNQLAATVEWQRRVETGT